VQCRERHSAGNTDIEPDAVSPTVNKCCFYTLQK